MEQSLILIAGAILMGLGASGVELLSVFYQVSISRQSHVNQSCSPC